MFELTDLQSYLKEAERFEDEGCFIALNLMTPSQSILVKSNIISFYDKVKREYNVHHEDIFFYIMSLLYGFADFSSCKDAVEKEKIKREISSKIPNQTRNFVEIKYLAYKDRLCCYIFIPTIITRSQYENLVDLRKKLEELETEFDVGLTGYNPYTKKFEEDWQDVDSEGLTKLDKALAWLEDNGRIIEYDLQFGEETIISEKKQALS